MADVNARKRGTKWQFYFEATPVNGKRKRVCKSGFATKKEAIEAGIKAMAEYNDNPTSSNGIQTVSELFQSYAEYCENTYKYTTYVSYESTIKAWVMSGYSEHKVSSITYDNAVALVTKMKNEGLSSQTMKKNMNIIRQFFAYAIKKNIIRTNPFDGVVVPRIEGIDGNPNRPYTDTEVNDFYNTYKSDPILGSILMLGYHCGLRLSESLALTWDDVDFQNKTILINKQAAKKGNTYYFTNPKYNCVRTISFDDKLMDYLQRLKKEKDEYPVVCRYRTNIDKSIVRVTDTNDDTSTVQFVVSRLDSSIVSNKFVHNRIGEYKAKGYKTFRTHDLRHTHCTKLVLNDVNLKYIQYRMGHKCFETTMDIYTHINGVSNSYECEKINNIF